LSRRGLCDGQITRPEESHRPLCVAVCDLETSWMRRSWPTGGGGGGLCAKKKQKKIMRYELNVRCDCKEGLGVCGLLHRSVTDSVSNDVHCAQINYFFKQSNILGPFFFYVHVTVHRNKFLYNKTNQMHQFPIFTPAWNCTCFGQFLCPSPGVYSLYTRHWYVSYRFEDSCRAGAYAPARQLSSNLYDIYQCRLYSE